MKKTLFNRLMNVFVLSAAMVFSGASAAEKVTLANGEWAPYLSENLKEYGVISDVVKKAFAKENIEVEYVFLPWKRGYEDAKSGKLNGSLIWSRTEDREKDFDYSDTVIDLKTVAFYKKGSGFDWSDAASMKGKKLGGVTGYSYGFDDEEKSGLVSIERVSSADANVKKLLAGRLDAYMEDLDVGSELMNSMGVMDQVEVHPKPIKEKSYHLILNKSQPENKKLMDAFNRGLQALKDSGEYDKMIEASRRGEYKK
ncbi:ABC-type amino acid transport/signal transduction systems, periplasmic component/domain [Hahella chejuensis KCTC 2396]|uniref:ABC-type amino acid transport/signal transduction systems, periplasmic component/domain n=1 Tax=Hahella chejuensis (strain KCTC 2396) TaxID=349521 RepID=Q2SB46_HAHCH|nr:transporter substrate-binding domain-containing protein [Hahella chejuensis]ABC32128.1 ABC-type amino acid transport/signal transduction systems, periplasmic component/domain [Hahella chejuensis KCTC 2396]